MEEEAEYGNRQYLEKQDYILAKQKEQLAAQEQKLEELTLKIEDVETLLMMFPMRPMTRRWRW